jgi:hypothetical protein
MNKNKIMGVVRHVLTFGGGFLVARGFMDGETLGQVVTAVVTIVGFAWSILAPEKL